MTFNIPSFILECIKTIEKNGYEAWCVGGSVRDLIMGKAPHDYDIATSADCHTVANMFEKTILTGEKHGTVTVIIGGEPIEVTTYRTDGKYLDSRAPETVHFVKNIEEDIARRDFTVNALCYHPERGILDLTGGIEDINRKNLRTVGNPQLRFSEDALRIMRLFRFSAQLNFSIEPETLKAALDCAKALENISIERIYAELSRLLVTARASAINPLLEGGFLKFCGINSCTITEDFEGLPAYLPLRMAVLAKLCGALPLTLLKRLKADNRTAEKSQTMYDILNNGVPSDITGFKRLFPRLSPIEWEYIKQAAEILMGGDFSFISEFTDIIIKNRHPYTVSMLEINGHDVINLGCSGKDVGHMLEYALEICLNHPEYNSREKLTEIIKTKLNNH